MPSRNKAGSAPPTREGSRRSAGDEVQAVLAWLERTGTQRTRDGMARYAIPSDTAYGIPVGTLRQYAKRLGRNHELAVALWETGRYEARLLASFVDDPAQVTAAQMDRWCRDFDSWAIVDTVCFHLFDRTSQAWRKVEPWSRRQGEFARRAAFALLASLALHDKDAPDEQFVRYLPLLERGATDERNFVKKAVVWALRAIGERNHELNTAAVAVSRRLAESTEGAAGWVGRNALKELTSPKVTRRLAARRRAAKI
ncbi:MAG: DNA alkylation repair protein [Gemmatimonadota bacterium]